MSRNRALTIYCLVLGGAGWLWLLALQNTLTVGPSVLLLFVFNALLIECFGFRIPPADPHSLAGIVIVTAALALGPADAALIGALEALIFGMLLPFLYNRPRSFYLLVARPVLRSGMRPIMILGGAAVAEQLAGGAPGSWLLLACLMVSYFAVLQIGRAGREYIQGGPVGLQIWWRTTWRSSLTVEIAPLPLAALCSAIYTRLGTGYFALASLSLVAASISVRRAALNLQIQRRSVRELGLLNEVSRAIIRSELDVSALCELIYREASKIVDTSSFHLGLFEGDTYTLMVQVQDRVRMPRLSVVLEANDGIVGWMRETGRALLVEDFLEEMDRLPARPRYQSDHPPRSGIYVPLIAGDQVIGSISIQSYRARTFDADDMRLLSLIADQAAVAIARARAYAEANQRANQLQAINAVSERISAILNLEQLLPSIVRLIREYFGYHIVNIFTADHDGSQTTFVFRASTSANFGKNAPNTLRLRPGQGVVGTAAAQGTLVLADDVQNDRRYITADPETRSELAVPLRVGDQVIGVLDVQSNQLRGFGGDDLFVLRTLADQIAVAIDSANSYAAQQQEAWNLNTLLQIAENLGSANNLDHLLPMIVRLPPLLLGCQRCMCLLWDASEVAFTLRAAHGLSREQRGILGEQLPLSGSPLLAQLAAEQRLLVLNRAQTQLGRCPPIQAFGGGTLVVLPLTVRASLLGTLVLDYDAPDVRVDDGQAALYSGVASQVAGALESALLALDAAEAAKLEQELMVAKEIQIALLPDHAPRVPGWEVAGGGRPARIIGGDFYDFWLLPPGSDPTFTHPALRPAELGFVVADVSDKGVPAAMFMALSRSLVRAAALDGSAPMVALERANRWITRDSESGMFVTLFYGMLSIADGWLRYCCAGHNPPLLFRHTDGTFVELKTPGIAMGVIEDAKLSEKEVMIEPGDVLVCYTDGVTEAINAEEEQFGVERLRDVITRDYAAGADQLLQAIYDAVDAFTSGQPPFDDITLMVLRRAPESLPSDD